MSVTALAVSMFRGWEGCGSSFGLEGKKPTPGGSLVPTVSNYFAVNTVWRITHNYHHDLLAPLGRREEMFVRLRCLNDLFNEL